MLGQICTSAPPFLMPLEHTAVSILNENQSLSRVKVSYRLDSHIDTSLMYIPSICDGVV